MEIKCFVLLFTLLWSLGFETNRISTFELTDNRQSTELEEQTIVDRKRLVRSDSPYRIKHDLLIEKNGELEIEPGVELHFAPMVGLTVRGMLLAKGEPNAKIIFRGISEPDSKILPKIRLVDGSSILEGRLQLFYNDRWRSVCSNSRNWTRSDLETACRQMGFQGGSWLNWLDREAGARPRFCLEDPNCRGTETDLSQCSQWTTRQLGAGVCDYHPDLAIRCEPLHATSSALNVHWRGIRFEDARHERQLRQENTLFVEMGLSELQHVEIRHAGSGRDYNASSAIEVIGVPPKMSHITIAHSLYNGLNITNPGAPFTIYNSSIYGNRGHGIFVNSTFGLGHIIGCTITDNGGDGIRYMTHWPQSQKGMHLLNTNPFCGFATTPSMIYPVHMTILQTKESITDLSCIKVFQTKPGQVLTIHLPWMEASHPQATANIRIYDGAKLSDRLLAEIPLLNNTRSQSVTSTSYIIMVHYQAKAGNYVLGYLTLTSGKGRSYDLNVTQTTLASNLGRGIAIDNLRSLVHVHGSSISDNNHVAGIHVTSGVGHINITESRIAFNQGDGINITVTGGARNVTNCSISSNHGYGIAIWLNETKRTEYNFIEQNSVIAYSDIFLNEDGGFYHGNFCLSSSVNITGNNFTESPRSSIEVLSCWRPHSEAISLQIGHNIFQNMKKLAIRLKPALNMNARIEYNYFTGGHYGALLINNPFLEEFDILPTNILVSNNHFENNEGIFVASLSLSIYSEVQQLNFTRNFIRDNRIKEPYDPALVPRGRVAAPLVVGSNNVNVFRNILHNPESLYEIGSQLEDQSIDINCTFNYLGSTSEEIIFSRLFDRKDRYNLARILYIPYLLHESNPSSTYLIDHATFVPVFKKAGSNQIGGEIDGLEKLKVGTYEVVRDISVRPQGTLQIQSGVTLRFPPGVGMIVAGRLEARGRFANDILFDLKEDISENNTFNGYGSGAGSGLDSEVEAVFVTESPENSPPIRLLGGKNSHEGRLQVRDARGYWGTVCDYGWTLKSAAIACHELGLIANPHDWRINRADIPEAGISEPILWSNVRCRDEDLTLSQCLKEVFTEFENSCTHSQVTNLINLIFEDYNFSKNTA